MVCSYVMMDYDVWVELVEWVCVFIFGLESLIVLLLYDKGYVVVCVMVLWNSMNKVMDDLYDLGVCVILVILVALLKLG